MVKIKPFKGIRPPKELAAEVASRPYDVLNSAEAKAEATEYVERFAKVGVQMLSFHLNAVENAGQVLAHIRAAGMQPGLAINPDIPVEKLFPYLGQCDYVVLMSVFAGFGGQKFIEATYERLAAVRAEVDRQGVSCLIQVDGGVSAANAAKLVEMGADILVAGSAVFKAEDPETVIASMKGDN